MGKNERELRLAALELAAQARKFADSIGKRRFNPDDAARLRRLAAELDDDILDYEAPTPTEPVEGSNAIE